MQHHFRCSLVVCLMMRILETYAGGANDSGGNDAGMIAMLEWAVPFNKSAADLYRNLTLALRQPTVSEPGCLHFDIYEDVDPTTNLPRIWQYLVFKDEEAHKAHMASGVVKTWLSAVSMLIQHSNLMPMTMSVDGETPISCIKQQPTSMVVVLAKMYTTDATQRQALREASVALLEPTRAEEGCLYYDQLLPRYDGDAFFVQEVLWFKDVAAHQKHMDSPAVKHFMSLFNPPPMFDVQMPVSYTTLPLCPTIAIV